MRAGYESPTFSDKVVQNFETGVSAPANVNYKWSPSDSKDSHLWQDVEFNRYNQKLMDTSHFGNTPAHFTTNDGGMTNIVHAPSDHGLQIISPASTTITGLNSFLETKEEENLFDFDGDDVDAISSDVDMKELLRRNNSNNFLQ
jgi:hypothetical protein